MSYIQLTVEVGTAIITVLTLLLAIIITQRYLKNRKLPYLYWSIGMWAFVVAAAEEIVFSLGLYNILWMDLYLFLVAMVALTLSMGSVELLNSKRITKYYNAFAVISSLFLLFSLAISSSDPLMQQSNQK